LDHQLLLAARPPSRLQRQVAYCVMACLLAAFCILAPFADVRLPPVTAYIPAYGTAMALINAIAAALMFTQFWVVRWTWLLVLASGFLFSAMILIPYAVTFPGALAPSGLEPAGPQAGPWLGTCWYLISPVFLIAAVLVREFRKTAGMAQRSPVLAIGISIALVAAFAGGLSWAIIAHEAVIPRISVDGTGQRLNNIPYIMALEAIAAILLWRRGRSVLDLWLLVMCVTWLFQISLGGILADSRYSLGWYGSRTFGLTATLAVLLLLLSETTTLYANTIRAAMRRRGGRHSRQIAMDAMAASIGHEIKQPLTALMANGDAGKLMTRNDPSLRDVHAIFSDMVAEGQRIAKIIGSVRTMFRDSTHDRQHTDVNMVVRDVLSTLELETRVQRVIVKTDLAKTLPPVLGDSGQLHQLFLNLVTNAIEAMAGIDGRPRVLTVTSRIADDSSDIAVTVEDSGTGIAATDSSRIFEPFFSTKVSGSGVGLNICQVILKAHGGRLEVRGNKPFGTIFRVTLPGGDSD
jgi:signal transduction histidine kinase